MANDPELDTPVKILFSCIIELVLFVERYRARDIKAVGTYVLSMQQVAIPLDEVRIRRKASDICAGQALRPGAQWRILGCLLARPWR